MTSMMTARRGVMAKPTTPAYNPASVTGLLGWWDASALSGLADGDPVATVADRSGNSRDMVQATAGKKPTYKASSLNGHPCVRFDGVDDVLQYVAGSVFYSGSQFDVFIVASRITNVASGRVAAVSNTTSADFNSPNAGICIYLNSSAPTSDYRGTGMSNPGAVTSLGTPYSYESYYDGSVNNTRVDSTAGSAVSSTGAFSIKAMTIGAGMSTASSTPDTFSNVDIAEVLMYGATVASGDRTAIRTYLKAKWGTP